MRRFLAIVVVVGAAGACSKGQDAVPGPGSAVPAPKSDASTIIAVGVEAGGIEPAADEGPAAVITAATGTVEIRRVGEVAFVTVPSDTKLYPGDVVRTGDAASATLVISDASTIELAEVTTVGVATRDGSADPASAAAVLAGLARFSVSPRIPGEGAFRVYTPGGVILTRGTVYGVGVAASGEARVGVESGAVDVIGIDALGGTPVRVQGGTAATIAASGTAGAPAAWPEDDWGAWRDDIDARVEIAAAFTAHTAAMAALEASLLDSYAELAGAATQVATFETLAAVSADKGDAVSYSASVADGAASIEASFALGGRIEALTWANASHAELVTNLYVRHPDELGPSWTPAVPHVDAAILWPKRFEVTAAGYLEPVRFQYYVHHPHGRVQAPLVGVAVPPFYAKIDLAPLDPVRVRGRIKSPVWIAPEPEYRAANRPVWVVTPSLDWRAKVSGRPAGARAKVAWYVRVPSPRAHIYVGANVRGKYESRLAIKGPQSRASLRGGWTVPVGAKVKVAAPDMQAAATARARVKLRGAETKIAVKVGGVGAKVEVNTGGIKAKVGTKVKSTKDAVLDKGKSIKAKIKIKLGRD